MKIFSKEKSAEKWQRNEVKMKEKEQADDRFKQQASKWGNGLGYWY